MSHFIQKTFAELVRFGNTRCNCIIEMAAALFLLYWGITVRGIGGWKGRARYCFWSYVAWKQQKLTVQLSARVKGLKHAAVLNLLDLESRLSTHLIGKKHMLGRSWYCWWTKSCNSSFGLDLHSGTAIAARVCKPRMCLQKVSVTVSDAKKPRSQGGLWIGVRGPKTPS